MLSLVTVGTEFEVFVEISTLLTLTQMIYIYIYVTSRQLAAHKSKYVITAISLMIGSGCKLFTQAVISLSSNQKMTSIVREAEGVHSFTSEILHFGICKGIFQ